jgi:hypothetical protein
VLAIVPNFENDLICLWSRKGTYVDVLGQKLVRNAVFVDDIVVHAGAGRGCTCEETEQAKRCQLGS